MPLWNQGGREEESDEALMERYRKGDADAVGVLYDRYARPLRAYVARRGARRPDDLVQDVFVRVVRKGNDFEGRASFKTWLFQIARNMCIDAARRDHFRVMPSLDAPVRSEEGSATRGDFVASEAPEADASRAVASRRFSADLDAALDALPDEQREVFLLRQISGLSFKEVAAAVGTNENTVKSRMRYALKALRQQLRAHHRAEDPAGDHTTRDEASSKRP